MLFSLKRYIYVTQLSQRDKHFQKQSSCEYSIFICFFFLVKAQLPVQTWQYCVSSSRALRWLTGATNDNFHFFYTKEKHTHIYKYTQQFILRLREEARHTVKRSWKESECGGKKREKWQGTETIIKNYIYGKTSHEWNVKVAAIDLRK